MEDAVPPDPRAPRERLAAVLVALVIVWIQLPLVDATQLSPQWDEFIGYTNARRVFLGEVPFVDYFGHAGVGADLLLGAFFSLLGEVNAGAARLLQILVVAGAALAAFLALRARAVPLGPSAVLPALVPLVLFQTWPTPNHHWLAAAWGIFALSLSATRPVVAGLCLGMALLSSQTAGLVACAAGAAWLIGLPAPRRTSARVAAGVAVVGAVFLGWLALHGGVLAFFDATIVFPLTAYDLPGGPNDVRFFGELSERFAMIERSGHALFLRVLAQAALAAAVLIPLALVGAGVVVILRGGRLARVATFGLVLTAWIAFRPRTEVFHAAAFSPLPLVALAMLTGAVPRVQRALTVVGGCAIAVGFTSLLVNRVLAPPPPSVVARVESDDPTLRGLPEADAWMIQNDRRLAFVRRFALENPQARMFAAPVGAIPYAFGPRPATAYTLVYEPTVPMLREKDYERIARELTARPPELLMFTSRSAEQAFLHPPTDAPPAVHRIAALWRAGYEELGRDQSTVFFVLRR